MSTLSNSHRPSDERASRRALAKHVGLRKISCWVRYDPERGLIRDSAKYKWMLATPSKASGEVLVKMVGQYVRAKR